MGFGQGLTAGKHLVIQTRELVVSGHESVNVSRHVMDSKTRALSRASHHQRTYRVLARETSEQERGRVGLAGARNGVLGDVSCLIITRLNRRCQRLGGDRYSRCQCDSIARSCMW